MYARSGVRAVRCSEMLASALLTGQSVRVALEDVVGGHDAPGVAIAVVSGGAIVASAAAGLANVACGNEMSPEGACNWFSMTKIATATAAMMLVDRGRLDLEAPVSAYLGEAWPSGFAAVRVRHLLNHSSGLRNPIPIRWVHRAGEPAPDEQLFLARLLAKQRAPRFEPGTRAAYSNVGYLALGAVIREASGSAYEAFLQAELLEPLGMSHTGYHWTDPGVAAVARVTGYQRASRPLARVLRRFLPPGIVGERSGKLVALEPFELDGAPYGGLIGSVMDAARLVALHCNDGMFAGRRLLTPHSVRAMADIATKGKPYDVGLGWFRPRRELGPHVEHFGGGMGFWNVLRVDPTTGRGVAVMSNTTRRWNIARFADDATAETLGARASQSGS
jgi:CubicO group peptidase (beta-lactamase class C family)